MARARMDTVGADEERSCRGRAVAEPRDHGSATFLDRLERLAKGEPHAARFGCLAKRGAERAAHHRDPANRHVSEHASGVVLENDAIVLEAYPVEHVLETERSQHVDAVGARLRKAPASSRGSEVASKDDVDSNTTQRHRCCGLRRCRRR